MPVVQSASFRTIEDAEYVFERQLDGSYQLMKSRKMYGMTVGCYYTRDFALYHERNVVGTLIIEGGYEMNTNNQRTITLVTIPQEVADAIEADRKGGADMEDIVDRVYDGNRFPTPYTELLRSIPLETLIQALVNGYTVEKSAEELAHDKIRTRYLYLKRNADNGGCYAREMATETVRTLDTLGIKITEVNA